MKELVNRFRYLRRRHTVDQDIAEEMRFHIDSRARELADAGMPLPDAMSAAHREFGSTAKLQQDAREAWRFIWLEDLWMDVLYGFRSLRQTPVFALTAIACLTLGIGANTTIFSAMLELMFTRPSIGKPDRLVKFRMGGNSHSAPEVVRFVQQAHPFEEIAGWREGQANWRSGDNTSRLHTIQATANLFDMIGIPVLLGRGLRTGDEDAVVLSHWFWELKLAVDSSILGRSLVIDGRPQTVVGVLSRDHRTLTGFGYSPDLYTVQDPSRSRDALALIARLPAGMKEREAAERLASIGRELNQVQPHEFIRYDRNIRVTSLAGAGWMTSPQAMPVAAFFGMLLIVTGLVLLIACANVSSLMLARASTRTTELGVRLALGAGRGRLIRQLLTEALLLAAVGACAGLVLNAWLSTALGRVNLPLPMPIRLQLAPNLPVAAYAAAVAIIAAIFTGLLPALQASRGELQPALQRQSRNVAARRGLRQILIVAQIAMSVVLLTTASLFVRNLTQAARLDVGFDTNQTLHARVDLTDDGNGNLEVRRSALNRILSEIRRMPQVSGAAYAHIVPMTNAMVSSQPARVPTTGREIHVRYMSNFVSPGYFSAIGIPIVQGRDFDENDRSANAGGVVVNQKLAHDLFGNANPVGGRFYLRQGPSKEIEQVVIGVAKNSKYATMGEDQYQALYRMGPLPSRETHFIIRTRVDPQTAIEPLRRFLGTLQPTAAVEVEALRQALSFALLPSQLGAGLLGTMGLLALLLASIGLFGVLNYSVARRTREFGVRIALGASRAELMRLVLRDTATLVVVGAGVGMALALLAAQPLRMFVGPEMHPSDPLNFAAGIGVLAIAGIAASVGPALRAMRVEPMTALRYD